MALERKGGNTPNNMDHVPLSVLPRVKVTLKTSFPDDHELPGTFEVVGPRAILKTLRRIQAPEPLRGHMSPKEMITIPSEFRAEAGIPMRATYFAYIHAVEDHDFAKRLHTVNTARHQWVLTLSMGGFAYFGDDGKLLQVNAITLTKTKTGLALIGPYRSRPGPMAMVKKLNRLIPVSEEMVATGFLEVAWIHPGERLGGEELNESHGYPNGAFLYTLEEKGEVIGLFYAIFPHSAIDFSSKAITRRQDTALLKMGLGDVLSKGLMAAIEKCVDDAKKEETLAEVTLIEEEVKVPIPWRQVILHQAQRLLGLLMYLAVGILVFANLEVKACESESEWDCEGEDTESLTYVDAWYLTVVSISTVGYGDLYPRSVPIRVFTAFYIIFGIGVVFTLTGAVFAAWMSWLEMGVNKVVLTVYNAGGKPRVKLDPSDPSVVQAAWLFYLEHLGFYLIFGLFLTQFVSAEIYVQLQPGLSFSEALWHCYITSTTVGYGEVSITTQEARCWAAFHILLSVNWLAGLIDVIEHSRTRRSFLLMRADMINHQLSDHLIDKFRGEITPVEFVFVMLSELGINLCGKNLTFQHDVQPLLDKFNALDEFGNGVLLKSDISYMVDSNRKNAAELGVAEKEKLSMWVVAAWAFKHNSIMSKKRANVKITPTGAHQSVRKNADADAWMLNTKTKKGPVLPLKVIQVEGEPTRMETPEIGHSSEEDPDTAYIPQ